eukprot:gene26438-33016_t
MRRDLDTHVGSANSNDIHTLLSYLKVANTENARLSRAQPPRSSLLHGIHTLRDGEVTYAGELHHHLRHGHGLQIQKIMTANGPIKLSYCGAWRDDRKHGTGVETTLEGTYHGDFLSDERHGTGVMKYADGRVYDGLWVHNNVHGKGVLTLADGTVLSGVFHNNLVLHGRGREVAVDGSVYEGDFLNSTRSGHGTLKNSDGSHYVGRFQGGVGEGKGVFTDRQGTSYIGDFHLGLKHGKGVVKSKSGNFMFHALWVDGVKQKAVEKEKSAPPPAENDGATDGADGDVNGKKEYMAVDDSGGGGGDGGVEEMEEEVKV